MFGHHTTNFGRCQDYASAKALLRKAQNHPEWKTKTREAEQYGFSLRTKTKDSTTWVREENGAVIFRLHDTDVVTYHEDGRCEIENWGSVLTSSFFNAYGPRCVFLNVSDSSIGYLASQREKRFDGDWRTQQYRVCGNGSVFRQHGDFWLPDEDTMPEIVVPAGIDRRAAREIRKQYNFTDFELWMETAPQLLNLQHQGSNMSAVLEALEKRDFRTAAVHLPTCSLKQCYGKDPHRYKIGRGGWSFGVTRRSVALVRMAMLSLEGALQERRVKSVSLEEYNRMKTEIKAREDAGCFSAYGFQS